MRAVLLPRYTIGADAYAAAGALAPYGKRIFLIGGETALSRGREPLEAALSGTNLSLVGVSTFKGECTYEAAESLARAAQDLGADIVAGMGGGKAIDAAKACAHIARLPVATFPTIAATCAAITKLSVLYHADGAFDRFLFLNEPPIYTFIDTGIIAHAPAKYLRAGMGDALAKHFEAMFAARGEALGYEDSLALAVSLTCYEPLLAAGERALADCEGGLDSENVRAAVQCNIVSTGTVSLLVSECYNGALAHSLFYAMENLPAIRACLHGDVVAWGVLVQLMLDGQEEKLREVARFLRSIGIAASLSEMGQETRDAAFLRTMEEVPRQPDMARIPYPVTASMVLEAIKRVEAFAVNA